jgi:GNAT superfamily N-acetyltransferase
VAGYYTLSVGQVTREEAPERLTRGLARHPVPVMLLARLAVALSLQGQGVGKALLRDAMQRSVQAADIAGIRAFGGMRRMRKHGASTRNLSSSPPLPIRCISLSCPKDVRRIISGQ